MSESRATENISEQQPSDRTLVGEAQSRILQQQAQVPTTTAYQQQQFTQPPEVVSTRPEEIAQKTIEGEIPSTTTGGEFQQQQKTTQYLPQQQLRYTEASRQQVPIAGGVREEVVGLVEPTHKKIHIVEQRPGEAIVIKQPPSYFYQAQVYPGVSGKTQAPIRDATIDYFNSLVAKNTHCLLGRTGIKVSRITLGTMNFGQIDPTFGDRPGQLDENEAHRILDRFVELGGNCIDTANFFPWFGTCGESERIVGSWLEKQDRSKLFIVTKVRMPVDPENINSGGLSRAHIIDSVKQSLKRLRTDYVDMLMLNGWDPTVSIHETVRHLNDLVRDGFIRYIGVCDFKGWQLQKFIDSARLLNMHKCVCYEGEYNLLTRGLEWEVVDVCRNERLGFFSYSPFKYGFLTNDYSQESVEAKEGTRIEAATKGASLVSMAEPFEEMRANPIYENLLGICERIGRERSLSTSQIAILWALQRGFVTSCVVGVSNVQQLEESMACLTGDVLLTQQELLELDQASRFRVQYPYTLNLSSIAGYKEIDPRNAVTFEQMSFLNEYIPFEQMEQMRLGAHETYHESINQGFPERQKFGEPSIREQQQQLVTPLEKQQQYGVLHQQEQSLQSGKVPVQPQLTTQLAQEQQQTRA